MTYFGSLIFYEGIYGSILPLLHPKDNLHSITYMIKATGLLNIKKAPTLSMLYVDIKIILYEFFKASAPETISRISFVIAACLALL